MRPLRLQFIVDEENLVCSQCEKPTPTLAKLPIVGLADHKQPWIGICRECAERLVAGFDQAEAKSGLDAAETVDGALTHKVEPLTEEELVRLEKMCQSALKGPWAIRDATFNAVGIKALPALLAEVSASRQPRAVLYFTGGHVLDVVEGEPLTCAVCDVAVSNYYEYAGYSSRRAVCGPCHRVTGGQLPRDKEITLLLRDVAEAREEIAAWRRVGEDFMPFFYGQRTELRHIEEAVVIFTKMRALLHRTQPEIKENL